MDELLTGRPFGGIFVRVTAEGGARLAHHPTAPRQLVDPSGRALQIATVEVAGAICPACDARAEAGFVSFVSDLRMVFACPACEALVWTAGS